MICGWSRNKIQYNIFKENANMSIKDTIVDKIQQMPEPLAEEVSDYIDFLLMKQIA